MWLGSLLKGLGGGAGGCLWNVAGFGGMDSVTSLGANMVTFLMGADWPAFWLLSCLVKPSAGIGSSPVHE